MVKQEELKEHEWTQEELDDHRLALTKDTFCMAALLLILVRASRLMEYCEMPEVTTLEIIWALVAFAVVSFVLACHLVVLPPPVEKEQRAAIIAFAGHVGSASVQTIYVQWAYFGLNLLALLTGDAQMMTMVYRMSVWTNMQGLLLIIFFFKLHWYESRCRCRSFAGSPPTPHTNAHGGRHCRSNCRALILSKWRVQVAAASVQAPRAAVLPSVDALRLRTPPLAALSPL